MKRVPTFELLRERRKLPVVNPDNGLRFTISLREWEGVLWGVRVIPDTPRPSDADNQFVQNHCLAARSYIEEWLKGLWLARTRPPASPARGKAS